MILNNHRHISRSATAYLTAAIHDIVSFVLPIARKVVTTWRVKIAIIITAPQISLNFFAGIKPVPNFNMSSSLIIYKFSLWV